MDVNVGNIVYLLGENGIKTPVKVMTVNMSYRMDGSLDKRYNVYKDDDFITNVPDYKIDGIPLTDDVLLQIGAKVDKENKHGYIYLVESDIDTCIKITRDWRKEPSYHLGIEYTDSPRKCDENEIYNFAHSIKYIHELQNIICAIYRADDKKDDGCEFVYMLNFDNLLTK